MSKRILVALMLLFAFPVYAGDKQSPKVYTDEDLEQYRHGPDAVFPEGHETIEQYEAEKEQEETRDEALKDAYYSKKALEIDRICREEARHREGLQEQDDLRGEIEILRENASRQKYGAYPGAKIDRDRTGKGLSRRELYYICIRDSGIPPKYFGLDHW